MTKLVLNFDIGVFPFIFCNSFYDHAQCEYHGLTVDYAYSVIMYIYEMINVWLCNFRDN